MTSWNADADTQPLASGTRVVIASPHRVVRVVARDQVAIETPDRNRLNAVVVGRDMDAMMLALPDGTAIGMSMLVDNSLDPPPPPNMPFSQQVWVVN